jgi:DNA-damage-inducible protein D
MYKSEKVIYLYIIEWMSHRGDMDDQITFVRDRLEDLQKKAPNGQPYWDARSLMIVLDYRDWPAFCNVIEKAKQACSMSGNFVVDHFVQSPDLVEVGSGAKRERDNWKLSRYACYLVAMNGDPSKPEIATAQTYFTVQTYRQESQEKLTDEERGLVLRERVKDANRKLSGAAKEAGVRSSMFGVFHDAGYKGLYDGRGIDDLKRLKGIGTKENLLDCIGRAELAANEFRITQTEEKLRIENIKGEQNAIQTHFAVGKKVRKAIADIGGTMPERFTAEPSIKKLATKKSKPLRSPLGFRDESK